MKVLLIKPVSLSGDYYNVVPPLGLGYLATVLRKHNYDVKIIDCLKKACSFNDLCQEIRRYQPNIVGFQVYSHELQSVKLSLKMVKELDPTIVTVVGGPHPTAMPQEVLHQLPQADFAFHGEAELGIVPFVQVLEEDRDLAQAAMEKRSDRILAVPGLVWRNNNATNVNPMSQVEELDSIGFPAWDLLDPQTYPEAPQGVVYRNYPLAPMIITPGGPIPCTFCSIARTTIRRRSLENVRAEMELLSGHYGVREVHILDDNFTLDKRFVIEFCAMMQGNGLVLTWCCPNGVRLDSLNEEVVSRMKDAGCFYLSVGIESGSPRILEFMKKKLSVEMIRNQVNMAVQCGIDVNGFFILGFPTETLEEMYETIRLACELPLTRAAFYNFLPLPGTEIFDYLKARRKIDMLNWGSLIQSDVPYAPDGLSRKKLKNIQKYAYLRFYLRPHIMWRLLKEIRSFGQIKYIARRTIAHFL